MVFLWCMMIDTCCRLDEIKSTLSYCDGVVVCCFDVVLSSDWDDVPAGSRVNMYGKLQCRRCAENFIIFNISMNLTVNIVVLRIMQDFHTSSRNIYYRKIRDKAIIFSRTAPRSFEIFG